jgi:hypothetical protein
VDGKQHAIAQHGSVATGGGVSIIKHHVLTATTIYKRKMTATDDVMSDSPTQSNEDRSYEQYRDYYDRSLDWSQQTPKDLEQRTQLVGESQLSSSHEHKTLYEGDTGAVHFDWHPNLNGDAAHQNYGDHDRDENEDQQLRALPAQASQPSLDASVQRGYHSMPAPGHAPETPIVPPRPFQTDATPGGVMAPSQLFMQTQYTSGIKKVASPTSSRPSPNLLNQDHVTPSNLSSPLKDRGMRTSPTQPLSTSPALPAAGSSPRAIDPDNTIPGSPNIRYPRHRTRPEPIGDYTPIRNSPTASGDVFLEADADAGSDLESDGSQRRRRIARLKQERATRSLENISITRRDGKDEVEVPSTGWRSSAALNASAEHAESAHPRVAQSCGKIDSVKKVEAQDTVADSQEFGTKDEDAPCAIAADAINRDTDNLAYSSAPNADSELPKEPQRSNDTVASKETIPETSPAREKRTLHSVTPSAQEVESHNPDFSLAKFIQSEHTESNDIMAIGSTLPPPTTASSQMSRHSIRSRRAKMSLAISPVVPAVPAVPDHPASTSSSLTSLSATPTPSSNATPGTNTGDAMPEKNTASSPAALKHHRQKPAKVRTYSPRLRGTDRTSRSTRQWSVSTDELAVSTPTSTTDDRRQSRSFVRKSAREQSPTGSGILQGMTFATSFQIPQSKSANKRVINKKTIEDMILKAGGRIVQDGFHELFEDRTIESNSLTMKRGHDGFVALITDVHSRKPKYMQALALGLPCLSWKWVSACISNKNLVDWSPYLLCAGHSQVLGAVRSRSLPLYNADSVTATETISSRPLLLSDKRILLVMKKARKEEEKRMPYVFLAQALGASLVRVTSLDEARSLLLEKQDTDECFDSVYVEGHLVDAEGVLFGDAHVHGASKKRKRQSATTLADGRAPKRIKTLTDELVVQSLILGRLVEQDEIQDESM